MRNTGACATLAPGRESRQTGITNSKMFEATPQTRLIAIEASSHCGNLSTA
jgi:hypothetical protein